MPRRVVLDALTAVLASAGIALVAVGGRPADVPQRASATNLAAVQGPPAPVVSPAPYTGKSRVAKGPVPLTRAVPTRLDIPAIGVSTPLMTLGLNGDGTIAVPPLRTDAPAGWYRYLATPGETGPAVILGHVDTARDGPAVFYRLRDLRPGDRVSVQRADGRTAVFAVDRVAEYAKADFPAAAVYGSVDRPVLRLITCGGTFDASKHSYQSNIVAYAALVSAHPA
jgi:sortase (surface protein transpeptidase)